jgi:mannose-6-phosphate isomerase-like protein (cupin superfamily)
MKWNSGHDILPHRHNKIKREINYTSEVLFVKSGTVRVDFYDENEIYLESYILEPKDVILLTSGGHGFSIINDAEIIEVKQGPYSSENDKIRFNKVIANNIKIINL